jgi:hypothetical protein
MATARQTRKSNDEEAILPQTPPPANQGFGHGLDPGFIWQQLSDIQSKLGAIQATQQQHTTALQGVLQQHAAAFEKAEEKHAAALGKAEEKLTAALVKCEEKHAATLEKAEEKLSGKLSKIDGDVNEFKQIRHTAKVVGWIVGIAAGAVVTIAGFVAKEAWNVMKPLAASAAQAQAARMQPPAAPPQTTPNTHPSTP